MEIQSEKSTADAKVYSYFEYRQLVQFLKERGGTTGPQHTEDLAHYTSLNHQRMKRLDRSILLRDSIVQKIKAINRPLKWVVLTESWCGDAAQALPVMQKLAELNENIKFEVLLRDENPEIMDRHLTNCSRSIPKLVISDEHGNELGKWGPRPVELQRIYDNWRNDPNKVSYKEFNVTIQHWYNKDRTNSIQCELEILLENILEAQQAA